MSPQALRRHLTGQGLIIPPRALMPDTTQDMTPDQVAAVIQARRQVVIEWFTNQAIKCYNSYVEITCNTSALSGGFVRFEAARLYDLYIKVLKNYEDPEYLGIADL
ncbi:hypothetical protein MYO4S_00066 [Serratia phage 4S]|nr:hypothetical protein MYO4S_00066 [Serratia phage 4S]